MNVDVIWLVHKAWQGSMDRRTIKIEIPLPRLPEHRFLRVSLRTVMLAVAAVAMLRDAWPPRIWISRPHFTNPGLTESIVIDCSGSPDAPQLSTNVKLGIGDSVFIDYRDEATARLEREADSSFDDWIERTGAPATAQNTE